jgi:DNA-binding NtrC family response regulator
MAAAMTPTSATAKVALAVAAAAGQAGKPPCVLVTDVNLGGGMDGPALAVEVRRRWPGVGVVVMTGNPANLGGHRPRPREVCLFKPFGPPVLTTAVHGLMDRRSRH